MTPPDARTPPPGPAAEPAGPRADSRGLAAGDGRRWASADLFDDAALQRARGCRFFPAMRSGAAVESWVEFPVRFALAG